MPAGLYIAVEGGEGAGKSTQVEMLAEAFREREIHVVQTREPGATVLGAVIRQLLLERGGDTPGPRAEALLYAADRAHHVDKVVHPALLDGKAVVQDRSVGSSLAYQASAGGLSHEAVLSLSSWGTAGILPHLTFYLDADPTVGLHRAFSRGRTNRIEDKGLEFHQRVRQGFLMQAQAHNWVTVDATLPIEQVHEQILDRALTQASRHGHQW